jgi:large conductance mechanosensitive channel
MWKEFKAFLFKQNVMALAIAVVMGAATNEVVQAIVEHLIMPLVGILLPEDIDWTQMAFTIAGSTFTYGMVISALIHLFIVGFVVWQISKLLIKEEPKPEGPAMKDCPYCIQKIDARATKCSFCTSAV